MFYIMVQYKYIDIVIFIDICHQMTENRRGCSEWRLLTSSVELNLLVVIFFVLPGFKMSLCLK